MLKLSRRLLQFTGCTLVLFIVAFQGNTAEIDNNVTNMTEDSAMIKQGETLFQQACASCHGRDLSGSTGFNLKDGEWIHGDRPSEILNSINKGFMQAGMPGFSEVYSEQQLQSVVAFILSKREGFAGLTYKIYQMKGNSDRIIEPEKLIKSGKLASNIADFRLAEIQDYSIEFEGDFYTSEDLDTRIWIQRGKPLDLNIEVDGKLVESSGGWNPLWKLARGKQRLKITYFSGTNKPGERNVSMVVTNADMSIKFFPISVRGKAILSDNKVDVKASNKTRVQRKKILNIPPYSISVGLPSKMNYAFNTRLCSIVGMWEGDMLNVGPNINGRGEDGSLPLGTWLFQFPQVLQHDATGEVKCRYKGYKMVNDEPVFSYQLDGTEYQLFASSKYQGELSFHYQTKNFSQSMLSLSLPELADFSWATDNNKAIGNQADISSDTQGNFVISIQKNN